MIFFPDIHCLRTPKLETLTAFLHMPEGFSTAPVLESSTAADSNLCLITRTNAEEIYALDLSRMEDCGVRECQEQVSEVNSIILTWAEHEGQPINHKVEYEGRIKNRKELSLNLHVLKY